MRALRVSGAARRGQSGSHRIPLRCSIIHDSQGSVINDSSNCPACDNEYTYKEMNGTWVCTNCANQWGLRVVPDLDETPSRRDG
ncbi:hypothetical protein [Nocardia salmonicida]|uniref:hypothetical protein n=1 Tax=Nocardia salmonicida TaxID=53431 RepID=UPI0033FC3FFB